jgi:hypothetical protein
MYANRPGRLISLRPSSCLWLVGWLASAKLVVGVPARSWFRHQVFFELRHPFQELFQLQMQTGGHNSVPGPDVVVLSLKQCGI